MHYGHFQSLALFPFWHKSDSVRETTKVIRPFLLKDVLPGSEDVVFVDKKSDRPLALVYPKFFERAESLLDFGIPEEILRTLDYDLVREALYDPQEGSSMSFQGGLVSVS